MLTSHWEHGRQVWRRHALKEGAEESAPSVSFGSDGARASKTVCLIPASVFTAAERETSRLGDVDYVVTDDRELMLQFADKILMAPADDPRRALERKDPAPTGMSRWEGNYNGYTHLPSMTLTIVDRDKVTDQTVVEKLQAGYRIKAHPDCRKKTEWCKLGVVFDGCALVYDPAKANRQLKAKLASERRLERNPTIHVRTLCHMVRTLQSIFFQHRLMKDVGFEHRYDTFSTSKSSEHLVRQLAAMIKMTRGLYPGCGYRRIRTRDYYVANLGEAVDDVITGLPDLLRKLVLAFFNETAVNTQLFRKHYRELFSSFNQFASFIFEEHRAVHRKAADEKLRRAVKARLQVFRKKQVAKYREILAVKERRNGEGNS